MNGTVLQFTPSAVGQKKFAFVCNIRLKGVALLNKRTKPAGGLMKKRLRLLIAGLLTTSFAAVGSPSAGRPQQPANAVDTSNSPQRALINQYCVSCHNDRLKSGDLALSAVSVE